MLLRACCQTVQRLGGEGVRSKRRHQQIAIHLVGRSSLDCFSNEQWIWWLIWKLDRASRARLHCRGSAKRTSISLILPAASKPASHPAWHPRTQMHSCTPTRNWQNGSLSLPRPQTISCKCSSAFAQPPSLCSDLTNLKAARTSRNYHLMVMISRASSCFSLFLSNWTFSLFSDFFLNKKKIIWRFSQVHSGGME